MNVKKVIVCDMDGTLTPSKAPLGVDMAELICRVLSRHYMAVVSGGAYSQFQKQFLSYLTCPEEQLKNLFLFPTNGSVCYSYDAGSWRELYSEPLDSLEKEEIISALNDGMKKSGLDFSGAYGEIIEDRGSQITFSGRGQEAPLDIKKVWDPDGAKRAIIVNLIKEKISRFEIRVNSVSSIDINRKGIDKAYAVQKIKEILKVSDEDIIFVGDGLFKGGNDSAIKKTDVDYIQVSSPEETMEFLRQYT